MVLYAQLLTDVPFVWLDVADFKSSERTGAALAWTPGKISPSTLLGVLFYPTEA